MGCKLVLIGGGSYGWTPMLATDLFVSEHLRGGELVLVDINAEAADTMQAYCRKVVAHFGAGWRVEVAQLDDALDGADVVGVSISTGGLEAMEKDYHIPEQFGIYHTVGDTVGPGGISRTLRNVPVFVDFARRMERLCPRAWMVHVTNPLSQLTRAVTKTTGIRAVGLCHNYAGTVWFLADFLGVEVGHIDAVSAGVNHYTWLKDITCDAEPVDTTRFTLRAYLEYEAAREGEQLETGTLDDEIDAMFADKTLGRYIAFELFERFGYFPVGAAPHIVENLPHYCNDPATLAAHHVRRKGVLPMRRDYAEARRQKVLNVLAGKSPMPEPKRSRETFAGIAEGLVTGRPNRCIVAMPNDGQITNLPPGVVVETWAVADGRGVTPEASGPIPDPLLGMMQIIVDEQELAVAAALTGDRDKVVRAMSVSPMVANKDIAAELTDRLLEANSSLLLQFRSQQ